MSAPTAPAAGFDVESFIDEYYDAWSGTDEERILSYYADHVVLQIPGVLMEGKEALRDQFVRPFTSAFPGNWHRVKTMTCGLGMAIVEFTFEAEHTGPFAGHAATGARVAVPGCGVYEFDSAKRQITGARIYFDMATLLQTITDLPVTDLGKAAEALQLTERNRGLLVNTTPTTTAWTTRADGYCDFLNQRWLDYAGMTAEQAVGWGWLEAIHPEDRTGLVEYWQSCLASGAPAETEARVRRFDSAYRWFLFRANPVRDDSGRIVKWYGTTIDIEDRKRGEEALQSNERNLGLILNTIPTHIYVLNTEGSVQYVNQAVMDYTGLSLEDVKQEDYRDRVIHPEDFQRVRAPRAAGLRRGAPFSTEQRVLGNDGQYRWFLVRYKPLLDEQGRIVRWYVAAFDIEDHKRAEAAIHKSESKLRQVIDTIPALAWCNLPDGPNEYLSKRWHEYTGLSAEHSHGWGWQSAFHPDDLPPLMTRWMAMLTSGVPDEVEARLRRHDGVYRWFLIRAEPFRDESGAIVRWYGTSTDIDDRKRAEAQVEQAYLRLAQAQRLSKTGSFITDLLVDEHNWSEELCRIFEFDPGTKVTTEAIRAVFHPADLPVYEDAFKRAVDGMDQEIDLTYRIITPGGNVKHLHAVSHFMEQIAGRPVYIGAIQDVTERKVAEEALTTARAELAHMARVTTLSALTTSIAHEVNQPIAAVITSADACLRWLDRESPEVQRAREAVMRIEQDGKRAAQIIAHLKSFYRKDVSPQREVVAVNALVDEMLVLLRSEAHGHSVVMRTEPADALPAVRADRVQLQQVLMNLMLNGMEAMRERGGELTISTRREGGEVIVSVSDAGIGIPTDQMDHIFNAFVTTKAGGTGMGLAISRTIIEAHGGRLWATGNPGRGATLHFTLPTHHET